MKAWGWSWWVAPLVLASSACGPLQDAETTHRARERRSLPVSAAAGRTGDAITRSPRAQPKTPSPPTDAARTVPPSDPAAPAPPAVPPEVVGAIGRGEWMPPEVADRLRLLEAIHDRPIESLTADALRATARLRASLGDRETATEAWRELFHRHVAEAQDREAARALFLALGAYDDAERVAMADGAPRPEAQPAVLVDWAISVALGGRSHVARPVLLDALDRHPAHPLLLAGLARIEQAEGDDGAALLVASQAISAAETNGSPPPPLALEVRASALSRLEPKAADAAYEVIAASPDATLAIERVRHLIAHARYHDALQALALIEAARPFERRLPELRRRIERHLSLLGEAPPAPRRETEGEEKTR